VVVEQVFAAVHRTVWVAQGQPDNSHDHSISMLDNLAISLATMCQVSFSSSRSS